MADTTDQVDQGNDTGPPARARMIQDLRGSSARHGDWMRQRRALMERQDPQQSGNPPQPAATRPAGPAAPGARPTVVMATNPATGIVPAAPLQGIPTGVMPINARAPTVPQTGPGSPQSFMAQAQSMIANGKVPPMVPGPNGPQFTAPIHPDTLATLAAPVAPGPLAAPIAPGAPIAPPVGTGPQFTPPAFLGQAQQLGGPSVEDRARAILANGIPPQNLNLPVQAQPVLPQGPPAFAQPFGGERAPMTQMPPQMLGRPLPAAPLATPAVMPPVAAPVTPPAPPPDATTSLAGAVQRAKAQPEEPAPPEPRPAAPETAQAAPAAPTPAKAPSYTNEDVDAALKAKMPQAGEIPGKAIV